MEDDGGDAVAMAAEPAGGRVYKKQLCWVKYKHIP